MSKRQKIAAAAIGNSNGLSTGRSTTGTFETDCDEGEKDTSFASTLVALPMDALRTVQSFFDPVSWWRLRRTCKACADVLPTSAVLPDFKLIRCELFPKRGSAFPVFRGPHGPFHERHSASIYADSLEGALDAAKDMINDINEKREKSRPSRPTLTEWELDGLEWITFRDPLLVDTEGDGRQVEKGIRVGLGSDKYCNTVYSGSEKKTQYMYLYRVHHAPLTTIRTQSIYDGTDSYESVVSGHYKDDDACDDEPDPDMPEPISVSLYMRDGKLAWGEEMMALLLWTGGRKGNPNGAQKDIIPRMKFASRKPDQERGGVFVVESLLLLFDRVVPTTTIEMNEAGGYDLLELPQRRGCSYDGHRWFYCHPPWTFMEEYMGLETSEYLACDLSTYLSNYP